MNKIDKHKKLIKKLFSIGSIKRTKVKGFVTDAIYDVFQVHIGKELVYQIGVEHCGYTKTQLALKKFISIQCKKRS